MRKMNRLTARAVAAHKTAGYVGDGAGLWLQTSPSGTKSWIFRYSRRDPETGRVRAREMGLGSANTVDLAYARELAHACRRWLLEGLDPIDERARQRAANAGPRKTHVTFAACCEAYIEAHRHGWKSTKHGDQWAATLAQYAYPFASVTKPRKGELWPGDMPVADVTREHVLAALRPIWSTKTETASRVRSRIELVLNYAQQAGHRPEGVNPARWRGGLDALLPKPTKVTAVVHHKALDYRVVGAFMVQLRKAEGLGARALEFAILTAARSGEVRGATWSEIDLDAAVWVVPGERMKAGREHRVPLPKQAVELLKKLPRRAETEVVFASPRGAALSDMTLSAVMRRLDTDAVPHGARSTFRDWCGEATNFPRELAEAALAHVAGDSTEQAYRRGDALERRRPLMQAWADYCDTPAVAATVTPIATKRGRKVAA